jgi:hypothetical protein
MREPRTNTLEQYQLRLSCRGPRTYALNGYRPFMQPWPVRLTCDCRWKGKRTNREPSQLPSAGKRHKRSPTVTATRTPWIHKQLTPDALDPHRRLKISALAPHLARHLGWFRTFRCSQSRRTLQTPPHCPARLLTGASRDFTGLPSSEQKLQRTTGRHRCSTGSVTIAEAKLGR